MKATFIVKPQVMREPFSRLMGTCILFHIGLLIFNGSPVALYPLLKLGIAAIIAVPLCFLLGSMIRRIPLVNRVL